MDDPDGAGPGGGGALLMQSRLEISGRVKCPVTLGTFELRQLASSDRLCELGSCRIELIDLFGRVRVGADAEIVVVTTRHGSLFAWRVDAMLSNESMCLEIETSTADGRFRWNSPVALRGTGLDDQVVDVRRIEFTTFSTFIGDTP